MSYSDNRSRRSFLKALASVGLASQFSGLFRDVLAAPTPNYPRFVVLSNPHGYAPKYWSPRALGGGGAAGETGWTLDFPNSSLAPLEKHKDSLVLIEGLDLTTDTHNPAFYTGGHNTLSVLTGMHPMGAGETANQYKSLGPSIDYYLAKVLKTPEFLFIATGYEGAPNEIGAFREDGSPVLAEYDLRNSLQNWFANIGSGPVDPAAAAAKAQAQKSVVDYLNGRASSLRGRLAGPERSKLDAHLDALSDLNQRINATPSITCQKPTQPPTNQSADKYMLTILDFTAQLLACNLTRVVNISLDPVNSGAAPWLASQDPIFSTASLHNDIAHSYRPEDDLSQRRLSIIHNYYAGLVSYFIDLLKAIPEGNGTAYDNTIILWVNELGDPARHMHTNLPFVLAGGGGKYAKGRYLKHGLGLEDADTNDPHTRLLTSLVNQYDVNLPVFGDPQYSGELPTL